MAIDETVLCGNPACGHSLIGQHRFNSSTGRRECILCDCGKDKKENLKVPKYSDYKNYTPVPVDASEHSPGKLEPTAKDIEGPFYKAGAPAWAGVEKPTLFLSGHVVDQNRNPVAAVLDFWQADENGVYDNDGYKLRGKFNTLGRHGGKYNIETVHPGHYEIGPDEYRCSHIHAKVWVGGECVLTTQIYFVGDEYNPQDHWFDVTRAVTLKSTSAGDFARFDFVIKQ